MCRSLNSGCCKIQRRETNRYSRDEARRKLAGAVKAEAAAIVATRMESLSIASQMDGVTAFPF